MEDSRIIELFNDRSESAISSLAKKYGALCRRTAENILKNTQDAEECVNDAYLSVWNTIPPQNPNPLVAYLCRIVKNLALTKYRNKTAKKRNSYYDVPLSELEECIPAADSTERECDVRELTREINNFLLGLDKENRMMFMRRYWYNDTVKYIAKTMGITPNAASARLLRVRENLREYLDKKGVRI
ncbi:MAG: sigma-70 family RNA polymerase sigma factor [Eubacterium sp.]|nr:sigma-70 family RNA polymerase sigma factor [Eubacterium sp.]